MRRDRLSAWAWRVQEQKRERCRRRATSFGGGGRRLSTGRGAGAYSSESWKYSKSVSSEHLVRDILGEIRYKSSAERAGEQVRAEQQAAAASGYISGYTESHLADAIKFAPTSR